MLEPYKRGHCPITIRYQNCSVGGELELSEEWKVSLDEHLLEGLRDWLQPENVQVLY